MNKAATKSITIQALGQHMIEMKLPNNRVTITRTPLRLLRPKPALPVTRPATCDCLHHILRPLLSAWNMRTLELRIGQSCGTVEAQIAASIGWKTCSAPGASSPLPGRDLGADLKRLGELLVYLDVNETQEAIQNVSKSCTVFRAFLQLRTAQRQLSLVDDSPAGWE